jgi:ubiquinone/menaquinone biosynthesis C-methylase UbiE
MDGTSHRVRSRLERAQQSGPQHLLPLRNSERDGPPVVELPPPESADQLFLEESLRTRLSRRREPHEPFSLGWFETIEQLRYTKRGAWLPRLLEFAKHRGDVMLGLDSGLGTDWVQYAKHGAEITGCCATPEQFALVQRNFSLRGLPAQLVMAEATALPFADESIDVVYMNDLPEPAEQAVHEIFRVLRPGGKALAVLPARRNAAYWQTVLSPWSCFRGATQIAQSGRSFTAEQACRLFGSFTVRRIRKRQLDRSEAPSILCGLPVDMLERLMGRHLIVKAFKPLPVVVPTRVAA